MTLTITSNPSLGNVLVASTSAMTTIETSIDNGSTWTTHSTASTTSRTLWEVPPALPFLVRAGGVTSAPQTLPLAGYLFGIWLTSVRDTSLSVAFGLTSNEQQGWDTLTGATSIVLAGQQHKKTFFSSLWTHQYDVDILIPPYLQLQNGTTIYAPQVVAALDAMEGTHDELVYRDFEGIIRHCYLTTLKPKRYKSTFKQFTASLIQKDTFGALPFTT